MVAWVLLHDFNICWPIRRQPPLVDFRLYAAGPTRVAIDLYAVGVLEWVAVNKPLVSSQVSTQPLQSIHSSFARACHPTANFLAAELHIWTIGGCIVASCCNCSERGVLCFFQRLIPLVHPLVDLDARSALTVLDSIERAGPTGGNLSLPVSKTSTAVPMASSY